jgi:hypothetical protein
VPGSLGRSRAGHLPGPQRQDRLLGVGHTLSGATDPDGDAVRITVTGVTQDEPVGRRPDARAAASSNQVELRGRRWNKGDGRVYRIAFTASDGTDSCSGVATVEVRRKKKQPAVDSAPPSYDSFSSSTGEARE